MKYRLAILKFILICSILINGPAYAENFFLSCVNESNDYIGDSYAREIPYPELFEQYGTESVKPGIKNSIKTADRKLTLIPLVGERVNYFNFALSNPRNANNSVSRGFFIFNSEEDAKDFCSKLSKLCIATFGKTYPYPMAGSDTAGLKRIIVPYQLDVRDNGVSYKYCPNPMHKVYSKPKLSFEELKNCNGKMNCVME